jgi:hypothetical protein
MNYVEGSNMVCLRHAWTYFKATINLKFITVSKTLILQPSGSKNRFKTIYKQLKKLDWWTGLGLSNTNRHLSLFQLEGCIYCVNPTK